MAYLALTVVLKALFILVTVHITVLSITLYLHRGQTHGAVTFHPALRVFFKFWLWFTCALNRKGRLEWIGLHRLHHATTDTKDDPHNPQEKGPLKLFVFALYYYRSSVNKLYKNKMPSGQSQFEHYTNGLDPSPGILEKIPGILGPVCAVVLYSYLFGTFGLVAGIIQTLWMPVVAGGVINVLGHTVGHQPYDSGDSSRSLVPKKASFGAWTLVALLNWGTGGEHLHNPHHTKAGSAKFGPGTGLHFDIGYWWLQKLNDAGGVQKMHVPLWEPAKQ